MKDDLKLSQYNVYHQYDSDGKKFLLVYNSFTKKMISVENYSSIFSPISLINKLLESSQNEAVFKDLGMLVDKDVHEFNSAHFECIRKIFSNDILKITIIPTDDCNFRCVYCYQDSEKHYINSDTEQRIIRYLEKNVRNFKTLYIGWFGGEPLLCKKQLSVCPKKSRIFAKKTMLYFIRLLLPMDMN